MGRATLITGFCAGKGNTERLAEALVTVGPYDDIDAFTFEEAERQPDTVCRAMQGVPTITHSMGALAIDQREAAPSEIHLLGSPLPSSKLALVGRGTIVAARMHTPGIGVHTPSDLLALARFDGSYVQEAVLHGATYFCQLGAIARFDGVETAVAARGAGISSSLMYADGDAFFKLTDDKEAEAARGGVRVVRLPGEHNDPLLRASFVPDYFAVVTQSAPFDLPQEAF
jgi:hypothetical protein